MICNFRLERELHFERAGNVLVDKVVVGEIEEVDSETYACHYQLPVLGDGDRKIYGVDQLHALTLCLAHIKILITRAATDGVCVVWWISKGDNGGF